VRVDQLATRLPASVRKWLPQKVRTRLTLLYAALFLAGGVVLLGLTFGLVAHSLSTGQSGVKPAPIDVKLLKECKAPLHALPDKSPNPLVAQCKKAFNAGFVDAAAAQRTQTLDYLHLYSLIGLGVLTLASGGLGWVVSGRVLRPVIAITDAARRASEQHLGERLALAGPRDELKELADTFDAMLDRLDVAFSTQRSFVANASHELRTPLTVMRTAMDVTLAKPSYTHEQITLMAAKVRRSIDQAEDTIDALLVLATSDQGLTGREYVDLSTAAEDALENVANSVSEHHLDFEVDLLQAEVMGDRVLLERMVANVIDNAVLHNVDRGWIRLRTGTHNGRAYFDITNSGPFVPEERIPSLFEPFQRGEDRARGRKGVGLGLSIVRSVVAAHNASVEASSLPEGGLRVRIELSQRIEEEGPDR
jgi:signal transduction histidine kinase